MLALRLTLQNASDVQSKTNEEGKMHFQKKTLNLEPPTFGKKKVYMIMQMKHNHQRKNKE